MGYAVIVNVHYAKTANCQLVFPILTILCANLRMVLFTIGTT